MAEIYFTSDHHFGHEGIIAMCNRPFSSLEEMDAVMIQRWNETVRPADTVYHLGDFAHKATAERAAQVFKRLNGKKHLIVGNHDKLHVRELPWASAPADRVYVRHPREAMPIVCDHYAARVWSKSHHGALHFYGHSHGSLPGAGNSLDVGVDCWDFRPVTLEEIRLRLAEQAELAEITAMVAADEES